MPALIVAPAVGALVAMFWPLFEPGLAYGMDVALHVGNVVESAFLLSHCLPPWDWLPDVAGGHGGPNYIFYGHLAFMVPAVAVKLGASPVVALKVLIAFSLLIGLISSALWCSLFAGRLGALLGAVLFLYGPYYLELAYIRGAYPELLALSLTPLAFFLAHKASITGKAAHALLAGLVTGAILAIHTLSLILIVPALVMYWVAVSLATRRTHCLPRCFLMLSLAAVVAGPYLIGPLFETGRVDIERQFQAADVFQSAGIPWYSLFNRRTSGDVASHIMPGRLHLLGLAAAVVSLLTRRAGRDRLLTLHAAGAFLALALSERSVANLAVALFPPVRYLQFPWRFLGLFDLFSASLLAMTLSRHGLDRGRGGTVAAALLPAACFALYFGTIPPQKIAYLKEATRSGIRESLTTLDHENKYMTVGSKLPKREAPPLANLLQARDSQTTISLVSERLNDYTFRAIAPRAEEATFHQLWYPGWKALLDGKDLPLAREEQQGLIKLEVPAGQHELRIFFAGSRLRAAAAVLSWLTVGAIAMGFCVAWTRRLRGRTP